MITNLPPTEDACIFHELPQELIAKICDNLKLPEILKAMEVCQTWQSSISQVAKQKALNKKNNIESSVFLGPTDYLKYVGEQALHPQEYDLAYLLLPNNISEILFESKEDDTSIASNYQLIYVPRYLNRKLMSLLEFGNFIEPFFSENGERNPPGFEWIDKKITQELGQKSHEAHWVLIKKSFEVCSPQKHFDDLKVDKLKSSKFHKAIDLVFFLFFHFLKSNQYFSNEHYCLCQEKLNSKSLITIKLTSSGFEVDFTSNKNSLLAISPEHALI